MLGTGTQKPRVKCTCADKLWGISPSEGSPRSRWGATAMLVQQGDSISQQYWGAAGKWKDIKVQHGFSQPQHDVLEKAQGGEKFACDCCLRRRTLPAPPLGGLVQREINRQGFSDLRVFLCRIFYLDETVSASPLINSLTLDWIVMLPAPLFAPL